MEKLCAWSLIHSVCSPELCMYQHISIPEYDSSRGSGLITVITKLMTDYMSHVALYHIKIQKLEGCLTKCSFYL